MSFQVAAPNLGATRPASVYLSGNEPCVLAMSFQVAAPNLGATRPASVYLSGNEPCTGVTLRVPTERAVNTFVNTALA